MSAVVSPRMFDLVNLEPDEIRPHFTKLEQASHRRRDRRKVLVNELAQKFDDGDRSDELVDQLYDACRDAGFNNEAVAKKLAWRTRAARLRATAPDLQAAREAFAIAEQRVKGYDEKTQAMAAKAVEGYDDADRSWQDSGAVRSARADGLRKLLEVRNDARDAMKRAEQHHTAMNAAALNGRF